MRILLPTVSEEWEDDVYPYLAFCYRMKFQQRRWTGYKELEEYGLDANWLLSLGILNGPTQTGSYRFVEENIINLVKIYCIGEPEEYESNDNLWIELDYSEYIFQNKEKYTIVYGNGCWDLGYIPEGADANKWVNNHIVAYYLKSKSWYEDKLIKVSAFDFDTSLYDCLTPKQQEYFIRRIDSFKNFDEPATSAQQYLESYVERIVKKSIKNGTYNSLPDPLKEFFSNWIKRSKKRINCWKDYICDQTNKLEE